MRAATFNIHHGASADDHLDLARTAAEIRALDADVVGLQEVDVAFGDRSAGQDQARELAEMLEMDVAFAPAIDRPAATPDGPRRQYGVALLVRGTILDVQTHLLPAGAGFGALREPRVVLCASVRTTRGTSADATGAPGASPGAELTVLVTHLDKERREHRVAQIGRILDLEAQHAQDRIGRRAGEQTGGSAGATGQAAGVIGQEPGTTGQAADATEPASGAPAVLLGDMNADQGAPEMQLLAVAGWRDAALEANGRTPSAGTAVDGAGATGSGSGLAALLRTPALTVASTAVASALAHLVGAATARLARGRRANGRGGGVRGSFPAVFPVRRIDGIWLHGPLAARTVEVAPGKASDHRPVVATLEITGGS